MAGTTQTPNKQALKAPLAGPPNMHLIAVRQTAVRLAEKRWKAVGKRTLTMESIVYPPCVEWTRSARLNFDVSGFDFIGEPPRKAAGRVPANDGPIVDVAAVLNAAATSAEPQTSPLMNPLVWEELDDADPSEQAVLEKLAAALELYEPPAAPPPPPKEEPKAPVIVEVEVEVVPAGELLPVVEEAIAPEEEPFEAPSMAEPPVYDRPVARQPLARTSVVTADAITATGTRLHMPTVSNLPLRPAITVGPLPEWKLPKPEPVALSASAPVLAQEAKVTKAPEPKEEETKAQEAKADIPPEPAVTGTGKPRGEHKVESPATKVETPAPAPTRSKKKGRNGKHSAERQSGVGDPVEEPADLGEEVQAELLAATGRQDGSAPEGKSRDTAPSKPEPPEQTKSPKPVETTRRLEIQQPELEPTRPVPAAAPQAVASSLAAPSFGVTGKRAREEHKTLGLGLTDSSSAAPVSAKLGASKILFAVGALALAGGGLFWLSSGSQKSQPAAAPQAPANTLVTTGEVVGEMGWNTDYASDANGKRTRQISLYRPSLPLSDYRAEFDAEIEYQAVSWVVRASNLKSFYVCKLVMENASQVKLVRFPVLDGTATPPVEKMAPLRAQLGMVFHVRMDVAGEKYKVTVNGQAVDEWKDSRLTKGGFGIANEGVERGSVRTVQMWHLRDTSK